MSVIGDKLLNSIKELIEIDVLSLQLNMAVFNSKVIENYKSKISVIEKNIDDQISFYGKKNEDCIDIKQKLIDKYNIEFKKIYDSRRKQFENILNEIQIMKSNQSIAIANMDRVIMEREHFLANDKSYDTYIKQKNEFEELINKNLNPKEVEEYYRLLENLTDPLDVYHNKLEMLIEKFEDYDAIVEECEKKLEECTNACLEDFEEIIKYRNQSIAVFSKTNAISKILNKFLNLFIGKNKFEKEFIKKMEDELLNIQNTNIKLVEAIDNQTIIIIEMIQNIRNEVSTQKKVIVG